jgi:hypothetical protein
MFYASGFLRSRCIPTSPAFGTVLILLLAASVLWPSPVYATVLDVTNPPYNAVGDGVHDDTSAIMLRLGQCSRGIPFIFLAPAVAPT